MTKREAIRQNEQEDRLRELGFTRDEAATLRRISLTLHTWFEHECNGTIQRDGDDGDGKPFWYSANTGKRLGPVADREKGAKARLATIIGARNKRCYRNGHSYLDPNDPRAGFTVTTYIQTDPRGAALYILRPGDVPEGKEADSYYTRGICVY